MNRRVGWLIVVILAALLQTTWPEALKLQDVLPDFILLLTVFFALNYGEEIAMYTGVIGGLYQDTASNKILGHHVICLIIVGYVVGRLSNRLITDHPAIKARHRPALPPSFHGLLFTLYRLRAGSQHRRDVYYRHQRRPRRLLHRRPHPAGVHGAGLVFPSETTVHDRGRGLK
jgi:cell shape-determining protein MreD